MIDGVGTTLFTYSGSGQLTGEDGPFASDTITNIYWSRMRTNLTLVQPTGIWTNAFGYSGLNRLTNVLSSAGMFSYYYAEPSTRLTNLALPSGAYVNNVYDTMSRLTNSFLFNSIGTPLDGHVYQYDRENQRTNEVRADSSTLDFSYDNIGQLTIANSSVPSEDRGYSYDTAWNLNFRTNNLSLSTFIVNPKNELTNAFGSINSYDQNGNLTTANADHSEYEYDDENRLIHWYHFATNSAAPASGDLRTDFVYDGLGRLRKRLEYTLVCQAGSGTNETEAVAQTQTETENLSLPGNCAWGPPTETRYVYDGWRVIQERDGNNTPTVSYTRGNDLSLSLEGAGGIGGLLARSSGYSSGNWPSHADYYADGNGNITSLIDTNQSVVASYRYDPFGNIISKSGSLADANVYRFSSKEVHALSGMYYYGLRFYEPNLQRWINRDPLDDAGFESLRLVDTRVLDRRWSGYPVPSHQGWNAYTFVGDSPLNLIDAHGLCWENGIKQAQSDMQWASENLTQGFPYPNSPLLSLNSPLGQAVSRVYNDAQRDYQKYIAVASGASGLAAQASAVGHSSVGFVFSAAGVETFGGGAVAAAGGAVVCTAAVGAAVGYGISQIPVGEDRNVADVIGGWLYNLCPKCF